MLGMAENTAGDYFALLRPDAGVGAMPPSAYPPAEYQRVLSMTERLFPGPIQIRHEVDPEIPEHHYLVFEVVGNGSFDDIMARDRQWHREIAREARQSASVYTLMIDVQKTSDSHSARRAA
jgi:hypothetical protein